MTSWPALVSRWVVILVGAGKLTLDDGHDGALLDSRRALETVGVDTTEELGLQVHVVEGVGCLIVVGLDLACLAVNMRSCRLHEHALHVEKSPQCSAKFRGTHPRPRPQDPCQP